MWSVRLAPCKMYLIYMGRKSHETVCLFLSAVVIGASIYLKPITMCQMVG